MFNPGPRRSNSRWHTRRESLSIGFGSRSNTTSNSDQAPTRCGRSAFNSSTPWNVWRPLIDVFRSGLGIGKAIVHEVQEARLRLPGMGGRPRTNSERVSGCAQMGSFAFERHYRVKELAALWGLSPKTLTRIFE